MSIGASQARSNVAHRNAPHCNTPRYVEPNDGIGKPEQVINPPKVDAFGDPRWLGNKGLDGRQSLRQWALRPCTRHISDLVKVGWQDAQPNRQSACKGCLTTTRTADYVDSAQRLGPHKCNRISHVEAMTPPQEARQSRKEVP
jgi:hypothetical protein